MSLFYEKKHSPVSGSGESDMACPSFIPPNTSKISVFIITRNEENNIRACIETVLGWASEIIVVDAESTDQTQAICREMGVRLIAKPWTNFSEQKQFALEQCSYDWVLNLDADERVPEQLRTEIFRAISDNEFAGYLLPRKNIMWGRWLRHNGLYPDYHLRLFRRCTAHYCPERLVHEEVHVSGRVGKLSTPIVHYTLESYAHRLTKSNHYSTLVAAQEVQVGRHIGSVSLVSRPLLKFVKGYIFKKGFLDGVPGLIYAVHCAFAEFAVLVKVWEHYKHG